jgi:hypothetical protein
LYGILPDGYSSVAAEGPTGATVSVQAIRNNLVVFAGPQIELVHHLLVTGRQRAVPVVVVPPRPDVINPVEQVFGAAAR